MKTLHATSLRNDYVEMLGATSLQDSSHHMERTSKELPVPFFVPLRSLRLCARSS